MLAKRQQRLFAPRVFGDQPRAAARLASRCQAAVEQARELVTERTAIFDGGTIDTNLEACGKRLEQAKPKQDAVERRRVFARKRSVEPRIERGT